MRPASIDFAYWNSTCNEIFHYSGGLPVPDLNITTTELNYKGRNIFYTYGVEDPWQWVGVRESYDESVKSVIVDCDDCAHCVDLLQPSDSDPPELKSVREQIENSIATWINYYGLDI